MEEVIFSPFTTKYDATESHYWYSKDAVTCTLELLLFFPVYFKIFGEQQFAIWFYLDDNANNNDHATITIKITITNMVFLTQVGAWTSFAVMTQTLSGRWPTCVALAVCFLYPEDLNVSIIWFRIKFRANAFANGNCVCTRISSDSVYFKFTISIV